MDVGIVNHDNCVIHVAEVLLHPGLNVLDRGVADRVLADPWIQELQASGRIEVVRVGRKVRFAAPIPEEGEGKNFALEELGGRAREIRQAAISEQPDRLVAHYQLLLRQGGMGESEALRYIAQYYGLDVEAVARRIRE